MSQPPSIRSPTSCRVDPAAKTLEDAMGIADLVVEVTRRVIERVYEVGKGKHKTRRGRKPRRAAS